MPIYEFKCKECGIVTERLTGHKITVAPCPYCKGEAQKIISSSNFVVNGYNEKNGYAKKKK